MQHIDTALLIFCIGSILALYVWCFRAISQVRDTMFKHEKDATKHVPATALVYKSVCDIQVKRFEDQITAVRQDVSELKMDIKAGFSDVKELIKERHPST